MLLPIRMQACAALDAAFDPDTLAFMDITIRQAQPRDAASVAAILGEAAEWLIAQGSPMWRGEELTAERIAADIAAGEFFIAESASEPVGTLKFQWEDPLFWPDQPEGEAAYLHRLAVRRSASGGGVSRAMMDWAAARAREAGRRVLRLDCEASRARLREVYEKFGFRFHSERQVGPYFVSRYELPLH